MRRLGSSMVAFLVVAAGLLALGTTAGATPPPVSDWVLTEETEFTGMESAYRTQGVASDGRELWFSWNLGLSRTSLDSTEVRASSYMDAIPSDLIASGHNHIGDIDVHDGILYAPIEDGPGYLEPWIVLYRASDLVPTGKRFLLPHELLTKGVPWVAVDGPRKVAYTAEWNSTTVINVHSLDDFRVLRTITLDREVPRIQGAKIFRGQLYAARDNGAEKSIEAIDPETGHVTHILDRDLGEGYETEGIAFIRNSRGTVMATTDIKQTAPAAVSMRSYRIGGDTAAPALRSMRLGPAKLRLRRGLAPVKVTVNSSEPASAAARWLRCTGPKRRPCGRLKATGRQFSVSLKAGANTVRLKAQAGPGGRRLAAGQWRLRLTPTDRADITGRPAEATLKILPARKRR